MPITEWKRKQRHTHVGSSDAMAVVFGIDSFKTTTHDVYLEKTEQVDPHKPNKHMEAGTFMESALVNYAEYKLGKVRRSPRRVAGHLAANIDALVVETGRPIEAKTVSNYAPEEYLIVRTHDGTEVVLPNTWGEPETDQVPVYVLCQCTVHLICQPADFCHVVALVRGGLELYAVPFNEALAEAIKERARWLMEDHVKPRIPPTDTRPSLDVLKRIVRVPNKTVPVDAALVRRLARVRRYKARWEKIEKEAALPDLLDMLGDAEAGEYEGGVITYLQQRGADKVDRAALRRDGHTQYLSDNVYRVLRIKENK